MHRSWGFMPHLEKKSWGESWFFLASEFAVDVRTAVIRLLQLVQDN
jgi:hypothetical protein